MADVMSLAWWCRKANLERQASLYEDGAVRIGRGLAYHVTPTNMPVNFAFSWVFSMLAGNANVVRLPNREFPQIDSIVHHVASLLSRPDHAEIAAMNRLVSYGHQEEITASLSSIADVRIVWGGDATLSAVRKAPLPPRAVDIGFADRYSFCVLGAAALALVGQEELGCLASGFFNDAYLMDQNACSSPRLVVWSGTERETAYAADRFWQAVNAEAAKRYSLPPLGAMDKFTQACCDAITLKGEPRLLREEPRVYRFRLGELPTALDDRRCNWGYFYEYVTEELDSIASIVNNKYQTLTYFGVDREKLSQLIGRHRLTGIDRIVPVGTALDIGLTWDGYDLIRTLSRVCEVR